MTDDRPLAPWQLIARAVLFAVFAAAVFNIVPFLSDILAGIGVAGFFMFMAVVIFGGRQARPSTRSEKK